MNEKDLVVLIGVASLFGSAFVMNKLTKVETANKQMTQDQMLAKAEELSDKATHPDKAQIY